MKVLGVIILIIAFVGASFILGKYLYKIIFNKKSKIDFIMDKVDNFIYKIGGIKGRDMNWKQYILALLITNLILFIVGFLILLMQGIFSNNGDLKLTLSSIFNIAASFVTNTNLQNYSPETNLTNITQMTVITMYMFTSAATGFSVGAVFIRGITGHKLGNYYRDLVRITTRFLIPISFVAGIILIYCGVPQTLDGGRVIETLNGGIQTISYGPIASLESIKHLGTNGGGFFAANSAHPFENPTPFTNVFEMFLMMVGPGAYCFVFGKACKNKKQGYVVFIAALILLLVSIVVIVKAEGAGNNIISSLGIGNSLGNMEGKEVRFGSFDSSLFTTITTAFTTGSVNNMHDSLTPIGGGVAMFNMMLNCVFGGKGIGFINLIIFGMLGVFICGLMIGRTPEFLRRKIEGKEMKLISAIILIHPILILLPTALALMFNQNSIDGYHGFSQVLYQFVTSGANNGSAFGGLMANTTFYNLLTGIIMILGRYVPIVLMVSLASSMSEKKLISEDAISFKTDTSLFIGILLVTILVVGALTFLPVLVLGPGAEFLTFK